MLNTASPFNNLSNTLNNEIHQEQTKLTDNVKNLETVAQYCEDMYVQQIPIENNQTHQPPSKYAYLKMTQNYTLQAVASIADQINVLASNFIDLLNNETMLVDDLTNDLSQLSQEIKIHQEKVARREIGALTMNKNIQRHVKIKKPEFEEKAVKYLRKPIDYSLLDDVGHGVKIRNDNLKLSRQTSISSAHSSGSDIRSINSNAPNIKPPTPPLSIKSSTTHHNSGNNSGTVRSTASSSSYYRAPIAPPSVPSEYLSRQELGIYASKKDLNISDSSYGSNAYRRPSQTSNEYSSNMMTIDTLDKRMTNPYIQQQQQQHYSTNTSIGYASSKDLGIRSNLNNIDYATHGTLSRRPQLSSVLYSRSNSLQTTPVNENTNNNYGLGLQRAQMDRTSSSTTSQSLRFMAGPSLTSEVASALGLPAPPSNEFTLEKLTLDDQDSFVYTSNTNTLPTWAPPDKVIEKVITSYDYEGLRDDELSFKKDTLIYVIKKNDDFWYEGIMQDEYGNIVVGLYPYNYAETICKYYPDNIILNGKFNNYNNNKRTSEC